MTNGEKLGYDSTKLKKCFSEFIHIEKLKKACGYNSIVILNMFKLSFSPNMS